MNDWQRDQGPPRETWPVHRQALVVVRNFTSWDRLTDLLPLFAGDPRIKVEYTVDRGSNFSAGLERHLESLGIEITPWEDAIEHEYEVVLAAHANAHLRQLRGPVFVLPHGIGYNRLAAEKTGDHRTATGVSARELTYEGDVIPTVIGVAHPLQLEQVKRSWPPAADRVRVIGDPTFDRMMASTVRRREYRRALGVGDDRRLVVVSSTWGQHSLLGQTQDFVQSLVAQLPMDEYQVALVLHPNIWIGHIQYNVEEVFRDARDGGLLLVPPDRGWRAALIAADLVLGDHGSVTFYGAALGRPTAQVTDGLVELDPDSALAMFCRDSVRLDRWGGLQEQVVALIENYGTPRTAPSVDDTIAARTQSWRIIRDTLYELMDLKPSEDQPRMLPVPLPRPLPPGTTTSFLASAEVDVPDRRVALARFPGSLSEWHRPPNDSTDYFRIVEAREVHRPAWDNADVLVNLEPLSDNDAHAWMDKVAGDHEGARIIAATTKTTCLIWARTRPEMRIEAGVTGPLDGFIAAAAVYGWVVAGQKLGGELTVTASMGNQCQHLRLKTQAG